MTREEAKHIVDVAFNIPQAVRRIGEDRTYQEDEIKEAKEMAIKALEQEPCEDSISRQAVINLIKRCNSALEEPRIFDCHNAGVKFEQYVIELQPVKPQEPKTGRWKRIGYDIYECSICGQDVMTGDICAYRYCHCCGTRMESEG